MFYARHYAEAIFDLGKDAHTEEKRNRLVKNVLEAVASRGHRRLLPGIVREIEKIEHRERQMKTVFITAAREISLSEGERIAREHGIEAKGKVVTHSVDGSLIGGYVIRT
ncbi:F0F1 ATP synthase subunit delta, partial [bacterium]|nr:F0F1 ATP synthase subunit delta [bacterium]